MFNSAIFNSLKIAKFRNTLAAAAVHLAITDEVLEKILLREASYVLSALWFYEIVKVNVSRYKAVS
jgi:hypothetical protein